MIMFFSVLCVTVCILLVSYAWRSTIRPKNFPPGPIGLPNVGNIFQLSSKPHLTVLKWKEKFGDIFSFHDGHKFVVVLSDYHTVKKVFAEETVAGRVTYSMVRNKDTAFPMDVGLVASQGNVWKVHRRFALSTLRDLGMGRNWLEDSIVEEVAGMIQALKDTNQQPFDPKVMLTNSVSNVICALAFGKRFDINDPKFSLLTAMLTENIQAIKSDFVARAFPFLMWFPNYVQNMIHKSRQNMQDLMDFMREIVHEHDAANRNAEIEDYVYAYQREKEAGSKTNSKSSFDELQLLGSLLDLFSAGTETTTTTTLWAMIFMIENPAVMVKVQAEIDEAVGREKMLISADRALLPYTEAVIVEVQRCASLVPLGVPHRTLEEITIDTYTIPKGTLVAANLFSIHRDERYWLDPLKFDPDRFLDSSKKLLRVRPDGFIPFSIGKRVCLGEGLAKMELFLFIANLLRVFTLRLPSGNTLSHEDYTASLVNSPNPFKLVFIPRV